ncbi:MAG: O-antigen ligase family protein [Candidatus Doudnabacteria bacterium]|nr:O-antigen ligase family protein [Candidatus Doudnabacteria bacterium]
MKLQNFLTKENIGRILWFGLLTTIFFSIRKVFDTPEATLLGEYSDFTSLSLYLSDLVLLTIFLHGLISKWFTWNISIVTKIGVIIILVLFVSQIGSVNPILIFKTIKLIELLVLFELARQYFSKYPHFIKDFTKLFVVLALIQVLIAFFQVSLDRSVGLKLIGEPLLNLDSYGVAKFASHGILELRAYGTFPHPNVLSSFVLVGTLISLMAIPLLNKTKLKIGAVLITLLLGTGLYLTYSKAAIIGLFIGVFTIFLYSLLSKIPITPLYKRFISFLPLILAIFIAFWTFFTPRGGIEPESFSYRKLYNHVGLNILRENPIFGVGIGQSMLHMERFSPRGLESWEIQPIHNYFLVSAADGGVILSVSLLILFLYLLYRLKSSTWNMEHPIKPHHVVGLAILLAFLSLMHFDHYFYTLQQGQFLLWLILGLIISFIDSNNRESSLN